MVDQLNAFAGEVTRVAARRSERKENSADKPNVPGVGGNVEKT